MDLFRRENEKEQIAKKNNQDKVRLLKCAALLHLTKHNGKSNIYGVVVVRTVLYYNKSCFNR